MTSSEISPRSSRLRRSVGTGLLAAALLATGGTAAQAAPARTSAPTCAQVLARAAHWPGTMQLGGQTYRIYSDAYYTSLTRTPPCGNRRP